jgi:hypothetical protein
MPTSTDYKSDEERTPDLYSNAGTSVQFLSAPAPHDLSASRKDSDTGDEADIERLSILRMNELRKRRPRDSSLLCCNYSLAERANWTRQGSESNELESCMRSLSFIQGVYPLQLVPVPTPTQPSADTRILEGPTPPRNQNKIYSYHNHSLTAVDFIRPNRELNPRTDIQLSSSFAVLGPEVAGRVALDGWCFTATPPQRQAQLAFDFNRLPILRK